MKPVVLAFLLIVPGAPARAARARPWLFFDLGMTLIQYAPDDTNTRYFDGVAENLRALKREGYRLGLLVNWPEDEGADDVEKLKLLKEFTAQTWVDRRPMDWGVFDAVFFPPRDVWRKPHPYLFEKAAKHAGSAPVLFQGEDPREIRAARDAGLCAFQVDYKPPPRRPPVAILTPAELSSWAESHGPGACPR